MELSDRKFKSVGYADWKLLRRRSDNWWEKKSYIYDERANLHRFKHFTCENYTNNFDREIHLGVCCGYFDDVYFKMYF